MSDQARLYRVALPMRIGFDHPARRRSTSDSLLLSLTVDGVTGLGECAPRSYVTGETTDTVTEALRRVPMDRFMARLRATAPEQLLDMLRVRGFESVFGMDTWPAGGNNLVCLLETAVLDLTGRRLGVAVGQLVSAAPELPAAAVSQVLDLSLGVEEFLDTRGPFHFVKIKASDDIGRDVRTVTAIRRRLGPAVPVLVDANMSWTPATAVANARRLRACGVDHLEEPLPPRSWDDLRNLRRMTGIQVMLDESVCTLDDVHRAVDREACDAVNVRVAKNGGLLNCVRVIEYTRACGLRFQIGVQVAETGPLINASRMLALRSADAMTVEAGQSDRFFAEMIVSPRPLVDRRTNTIAPIPSPGFGLRLNANAAPWAALAWASGGWQPVLPEETLR